MKDDWWKKEAKIHFYVCWVGLCEWLDSFGNPNGCSTASFDDFGETLVENSLKKRKNKYKSLIEINLKLIRVSDIKKWS